MVVFACSQSLVLHPLWERYPPAARRTAVRPAARKLCNCRGTGEIVPFVNRAFEWAVVMATFLSVLSIVPRHCAHLTYFLHPKSREINAVLISPRLIPLSLRRLPRAGSIPLAPAASVRRGTRTVRARCVQ